MSKAEPFYQKYLKKELARRMKANPSYSLRALARALSVDATALSRIIRGQQVPSAKLAAKLINALNASAEEREKFLASIARTQNKRDLTRRSPVWNTIVDRAALKDTKDLDSELYRVIGEWYHMAILVLTQEKGFQRSPRWIAEQLGISEPDAKLAVDRLLQLHLLEEKDETLVMTMDHMTSANKEESTAAHRRNQRQFLEKAIESLENDPIRERSHTSMTMAISLDKLDAAKQLIEDFSTSLCELLETGEQARVYNLSIALFPLQK